MEGECSFALLQGHSPLPLEYTYMTTTLYAVYFSGPDDYDDAVEQLAIARIATTALHSCVSMQLEAHSWLDPKLYRLFIDASTDAGRTLVKILTSFLNHHVGSDHFTVCAAFPEDVSKAAQWKQNG